MWLSSGGLHDGSEVRRPSPEPGILSAQRTAESGMVRVSRRVSSSGHREGALVGSLEAAGLSQFCPAPGYPRTSSTDTSGKLVASDRSGLHLISDRSTVLRATRCTPWANFLPATHRQDSDRGAISIHWRSDAAAVIPPGGATCHSELGAGDGV